MNSLGFYGDYDDEWSANPCIIQYGGSHRRSRRAYGIDVVSLVHGDREDGHRQAWIKAECERRVAEEQSRRDRLAAEEAAEAARILEHQRQRAAKERDQAARERDQVVAAAETDRTRLLEAEAELAELRQRLASQPQPRRRWLCWPRRRQPSTIQEPAAADVKPPPYNKS